LELPDDLSQVDYRAGQVHTEVQVVASSITRRPLTSYSLRLIYSYQADAKTSLPSYPALSVPATGGSSSGASPYGTRSLLTLYTFLLFFVVRNGGA
jgi:hypothetical protein